jgi:septum formation protein
VRPAGVNETAHGDPRSVVVENALRKARAVPGSRVLGVDTAVFVDGIIHGKPRDSQQARRYLERLNGRRHDVWSGIAVVEDGSERSSAAVTRVTFRSLTPAELEWYIGTGEWRERAGAYAIQGRGAALVERVEGDFWNVVGLPVPELIRLLPDLLG